MTVEGIIFFILTCLHGYLSDLLRFFLFLCNNVDFVIVNKERRIQKCLSSELIIFTVIADPRRSLTNQLGNTLSQQVKMSDRNVQGLLIVLLAITVILVVYVAAPVLFDELLPLFEEAIDARAHRG